MGSVESDVGYCSVSEHQQIPAASMPPPPLRDHRIVPVDVAQFEGITGVIGKPTVFAK